MNVKKIFLLALMAAVVIVGVSVILFILQPPPNEIERVFPGDEALFIESHGLFKAWGDIKKTDYYTSGGYEPFFRLSAVSSFINAVGNRKETPQNGLTADLVAALFGDESALGIYPAEDRAHFLMVSRVKPDFLLAERLLIFAYGGKDVVISKHRSLRVKEVKIPGGPDIFWSLDGDFLICSDDRSIFYTALDRRIDKETGGIASLSAFRKMVKKRRDNTLISGFCIPDRLRKVSAFKPVFTVPLSKFLPKSLLFSLDRTGGDVSLTMTDGSWGGLSCGSGRRPTKPAAGDRAILAAVSAGTLPGVKPADIADSLALHGGLRYLVPSLVSKGFSAFLLDNPEKRRPPALILVGKRTPAFDRALTELVTHGGLSMTRSSTDGIEVTTYIQDNIPYLCLAENNGEVALSGGPYPSVDMLRETLEIHKNFGYNMTSGGLVIEVLPRAVLARWNQLSNVAIQPAGAAKIKDAVTLLTAAGPIDEIDTALSTRGGSFELNIDIRFYEGIP